MPQSGVFVKVSLVKKLSSECLNGVIKCFVFTWSCIVVVFGVTSHIYILQVLAVSGVAGLAWLHPCGQRGKGKGAAQSPAQTQGLNMAARLCWEKP